MACRIEGLDHLVLTVSDLDATLRFYEGILGLRAERFVAADGGERLALRLGAQKINLHEAGAEYAPHAARPLPGSADLCLLTSTPLGQWQAHLDAQGVQVELGPVPRSGATGPIRSIYIRDPDGNLIEIAEPAP